MPLFYPGNYFVLETIFTYTLRIFHAKFHTKQSCCKLSHRMCNGSQNKVYDLHTHQTKHSPESNDNLIFTPLFWATHTHTHKFAVWCKWDGKRAAQRDRMSFDALWQRFEQPRAVCSSTMFHVSFRSVFFFLSRRPFFALPKRWSVVSQLRKRDQSIFHLLIDRKSRSPNFRWEKNVVVCKNICCLHFTSYYIRRTHAQQFGMCEDNKNEQQHQRTRKKSYKIHRPNRTKAIHKEFGWIFAYRRWSRLTLEFR